MAESGVGSEVMIGWSAGHVKVTIGWNSGYGHGSGQNKDENECSN